MKRLRVPDDAVALDLPFRGGRWLVQNSPANRVPSHGTNAFGSSHAIDFVPVDERGRSAPRSLLPYMLTQGRRVRAGPAAIAGNHVVVVISPTGPYVMLAHLRRSSVQVSVGESESAGQQLGECGNSGNSTEPHVHVQVSDSTDWAQANGIPLASRHRGERLWIPGNAEIIDA